MSVDGEQVQQLFMSSRAEQRAWRCRGVNLQTTCLIPESNGRTLRRSNGADAWLRSAVHHRTLTLQPVIGKQFRWSIQVGQDEYMVASPCDAHPKQSA